MRLLRTEMRDHRGMPEEFCIRGITREGWARVVGSDAPGQRPRVAETAKR